MIVISRKQWDRIGQESFDSRLVSIIRRNHPDQVARMPFAQLVEAIHRQIGRARCHGLNDERSVATYVYAAWLLGEEFDRRIPAIAQILDERHMRSADKATALADFCKLAFRTLSGARPAPAARSAA
jgi:hypothetical protein